jgi:hypothetical protein
MARLAYIGNRTAPLQVINYSVEQELNSYAPGDDAGGTSSATVSVRANEGEAIYNRYLSCIDQTLTLVDSEGIEGTAFKGRGTWTGVISRAVRAGAQITFSVDSILSRLNVNKVAQPYFGRKRADSIVLPIVNAATNPSAEVNTTGYTTQAGTGGVVALSNPTTTAYSGVKVARLDWTTSATGSGGLIYTQAGLTGGATYTFSVQARADSQQSVRLLIQWKDAANANVGSQLLGDARQVFNGTWTELDAVALLAPVNATQVVLSVLNDPGGDAYRNWTSGSYLELDAWMITIGSTVYPFADGSSPNGVWNGTAGSSTSTISITVPQDPGYDATWANAFRYYCGLVGIAATAIDVDPYFENIYVSYPGWSGNVLDHIKAMSSAVGAIFSEVNGSIQVNRPHYRRIRLSGTDQVAMEVNAQNSTREVVVTNYNNQWLTDAVTVAPSNVYSIQQGQPTSFQLTTNDSLLSVNVPVCVAAITPLPYTSGTGQYVVTDSNNNTVAPSDWYNAGGKMSVDLDPADPSHINVSVFAPGLIQGYTAPFRLAQMISGQDVPALYITGTGVFSEPEEVTIVTGAPLDSSRVKDSSPSVDNIFLSDVTTAHDRGTFTADQQAGVTVTASGTFGFDPDSGGQEFNAIGSRYYANDGIYVITQTSTNSAGVRFSARMDVAFSDLTDLFSITFDEFNATYTGLTFSGFNALFPGKTFNDFNAGSSLPTFDTFNAIYAGATFDDHAVYPYRREVAIDNAEARF